MKIKKYKILTIFNSTRCDIEISKDKEKRLKEIIKEIKVLECELDSLFKNQRREIN